jgi:hypothetical protein
MRIAQEEIFGIDVEDDPRADGFSAEVALGCRFVLRR